MESLASNDETSLAVCIPSYRRPNLLTDALNALATSMQVAKLQIPLLIIVNGPIDYTSCVESAFSGRFSDLNVIYDSVSGLARARNTALRMVEAEWLAFLDDDAIPDKDWAHEALRAIENRTSVIAIGGPYFRKLDSAVQIPNWLPYNYGTSYKGRHERVVDTVPGGNMIVHRPSALRLGGFREDFGMHGETRLWGEESELQRRGRDVGLKTVYVPTLRISHLLHGERTSFRGALTEEWKKGIQVHSVMRLSRPHHLFARGLYGFVKAIWCVATAPFHAVLAPLRRRGVISEVARCVLASVGRFAQGIGCLRELLRLLVQLNRH